MKYSVELDKKNLKTVEAETIAHVCADLEAAHPDLTDPRGEEFNIEDIGTKSEKAWNGSYFVSRA